MTIGEAILAPLFVVLAFLCMVGAALAHDAPFPFHASLGCIASLMTAFTILNCSYDRPAELPPQEINGRPNYNFGPIKFATVAAVIWGIAGFAVGLIIASQLAWPALNLDLPWTTFGRLRPLHTSPVIFAFGGNVLIGTSFYVVQKTSRVRLAGELAPLRRIHDARQKCYYPVHGCGHPS
jgi:cytochrome c oxidase cbb3-type subunit I